MSENISNSNPKLVKLKLLVGNDLSDDILLAYLDIAKNKTLNRIYPFGIPENVTDVPTKYEYIQMNVASYLINKRGAEGETSHSENGVSRSYGSADVPDEMFSEIVPFGGLIR